MAYRLARITGVLDLVLPSSVQCRPCSVLIKGVPSRRNESRSVTRLQTSEHEEARRSYSTTIRIPSTSQLSTPRPSPRQSSRSANPTRASSPRSTRRKSQPPVSESIPRQSPSSSVSSNSIPMNKVDSPSGQNLASKSRPPIEPDVLDWIPRLFAPPDSDFDRQSQAKIARALIARNIRFAARHFSSLNPDSYEGTLGEEGWQAVSDLIRDILQPRHYKKLVSSIDHDPAIFNAYVDMAIEAAIRDHFQGLAQLFLCLIAVGRPQLVIDAYSKYRDGLFTIHGSSRAEVTSRKRDIRLAARVEAKGDKSLSTIYIAALSMSDQFRYDRISPILVSTVDWRKHDHEVIAEVRRAFSYGGFQAVEGPKYTQCLDDFHFIVLCHHPRLMLDRLIAASNQENIQKFNELYSKLLKVSSGQDPLVKASEFTERDEIDSTTVVHLPLDMWIIAIKGFFKAKNPIEVLSIVTQHLPERGIVPPPNIIAEALRALAHMYSMSRNEEVTRSSAWNCIEQIVHLVEDRKLQHLDDIDAAHIHLLAATCGAHKIVRYLATFRRSNVGPKTREAWVQVLLDKAQRPDLARNVLTWTDLGDEAVIDSDNTAPYSQFITSIALGPLSPERKLNEILAATKDRRLLKQDRVIIASIRLQARPSMVKRIFKEVSDLARNSPPGIRTRAVLVRQFLRFCGKGSVSAAHAEVALALLESFPILTNQYTRPRVERLFFDMYLHLITMSGKMSPKLRLLYQRKAIALLIKSYPVSPDLLWNMVVYQLSRKTFRGNTYEPKRISESLYDHVDVNLALEWWRCIKRCCSSAEPHQRGAAEDHVNAHFLEKAIYAFKVANCTNVAKDIVAEAWSLGQIPLQSEVWDKAAQAGVLPITLDDLRGARSVSKKEVEPRKRFEPKPEAAVPDQEDQEEDSADDIAQDDDGWETYNEEGEVEESSDGPYEEDTADSDADPQTAVPDTESSDEELLFGMSRAEWANADPVADMQSVREAAWNKIRDL